MDSLLGVTTSICGECRATVPARVLSDGTAVYLGKFCPEHGETVQFMRADPEEYLRAQRFVKPASVPAAFAGDSQAACPDGCGFCDRHEQHLCMPIVEITSRCDLACPVCLVDAGAPRDMGLPEYRIILDGLLRAERAIDILNLSGGEPLLHPQFMTFVDEALRRREIVRLSVSTNGLALLRDPDLLRELRDRNVVIALQFDGFDDRAYRTLRGRALLEDKLRILDLLGAENATASLTMTAAAGVNDDQFRPVLDLLFSREFLVSLMVQPVAYAGRAARMERPPRRLTLPDVVRLLDEAAHPSVRSADFLPLPCSHPLCFSAAFYLMLPGGGALGVARATQAATMIDALANRVILGTRAEDHELFQQLAYEIWSGPVALAPDGEGVVKAVRGLFEAACGCDSARALFTVGERRVKSIFIHAFQDADTFDLARVRRCCNAYPQPDGRLLPACVRNVVHP